MIHKAIRKVLWGVLVSLSIECFRAILQELHEKVRNRQRSEMYNRNSRSGGETDGTF